MDVPNGKKSIYTFATHTMMRLLEGIMMSRSSSSPWEAAGRFTASKSRTPLFGLRDLREILRC